jgi:predicted enzyme related to lactoylglutathione lyase
MKGEDTMKVTEYVPGTPNWTDLASPDLAASGQFYSGVFGWDPVVSPAPEAGGYTMFHIGDAAVAGLGPPQGPDQPPAWTVYFATDSADAAAARVEAAGGKVLAAPMDIMDQGRMAIFMDPTGAVFGVWQPAAFAGAQIYREPGALCWVELATRDTETATQFYRSVLGVRPDPQEMDGMVYTVFNAGDEGVAGMMAMTDQYPAEVPSNWMPYFASADVDATAAKIQELGGSLVVPPTDIPGIGRFSVAVDPAGAQFAVLKGEPQEA